MKRVKYMRTESSRQSVPLLPETPPHRWRAIIVSATVYPICEKLQRRCALSNRFLLGLRRVDLFESSVLSMCVYRSTGHRGACVPVVFDSTTCSLSAPRSVVHITREL